MTKGIGLSVSKQVARYARDRAFRYPYARRLKFECLNPFGCSVAALLPRLTQSVAARGIGQRLSYRHLHHLGVG